MRFKFLTAAVAATSIFASGAASADFGVGVKAGTLGLGVEARWEPPVPWIDFRVGLNSYDYDDNGGRAGIGYDATLALDTYFLTGNFKFPLSPFRLTVGAFSNGNELRMQSQDPGLVYEIGGIPFSSADVGVLQSVTSFGSTAPYLGFGFDFEVFGKAGLNLDFGVLWQGEPSVTLDASGYDTAPAPVQALLGPALEAERLELQDEMSDFKAWPVVSLAFVYNF